MGIFKLLWKSCCISREIAQYRKILKAKLPPEEWQALEAEVAEKRKQIISESEKAREK